MNVGALAFASAKVYYPFIEQIKDKDLNLLFQLQNNRKKLSLYELNIDVIHCRGYGVELAFASAKVYHPLLELIKNSNIQCGFEYTLWAIQIQNYRKNQSLDESEN